MRALLLAAVGALVLGAQAHADAVSTITLSPEARTAFHQKYGEREIATLVSQGMSNQQIADVLVASRRTVEGHIYRACQRLGVKDRNELAAVMRESGFGG